MPEDTTHKKHDRYLSKPWLQIFMQLRRLEAEIAGDLTAINGCVTVSQYCGNFIHCSHLLPQKLLGFFLKSKNANSATLRNPHSTAWRTALMPQLNACWAGDKHEPPYGFIRRGRSGYAGFFILRILHFWWSFSSLLYTPLSRNIPG